MAVTVDKVSSIKYILPGLIITSMGMSASCLASSVISPSIESSISYTDNVGLTERSDAKSSTIFAVIPGLNFQQNSRNSVTTLDYHFENYYFSNDGDTDNDPYQSYQNLSAANNLILKDQFLYFNSRFSVYQESIIDADTNTQDNLSLADGRGTAHQVSLNPFIRTRVGNDFNGLFGYQAKSLDGDDEVVNTTYVKELYFTLDSGEKFNNVIWTLNGNSRNIDYQDQDDLKFSSYDINAEYKLTSSMALLGLIGFEKNEYPSSDNLSSEDDYWSVGLRYQAGRRTSITMRVGHRYFGNTGFLDIQHQTRTSTWTASYTEDVTTRSQIEIEARVVELSSPDSDPVLTVVALPQLTTEAIKRTVTSAGVVFDFRKLDVGVSLTNTQYEYQESSNNEEVNSFDLTTSWLLTARSHIDMSASYQEKNDLTNDTSDEFKQFSFLLSRKFSDSLKMGMEYKNSSRVSDGAAIEYDRNLYSIKLQAEF